MKYKYAYQLVGAVALSALISSCGGVKYSEMLMFEQVQSGEMNLDRIPVLVIQPDDILSIQVSSRNPETVVAFKTMRETAGNMSTAALGTPDGYRVNEQGNIYLPFLGEVKAEGKTLHGLREEIANKLVAYIPDASVQVRFVNFRVTLMGEVKVPNTYIIPNERLTILEAIGMAGDFTDYARRNAVMVVRERNGVREFARVNTQDPELFQSPYFYLSPNDIIYVEPLKAKQYATRGDFIDRYSVILVPFVSALTFLVVDIATRK
ncbi:MAG: polysaccharide biosynthesis/export family protein [Lewinellaceae bacterium]|nr:polysaccharide biosynthesis/export family protein [Lewinellaceae bacterium]